MPNILCRRFRRKRSTINGMNAASGSERGGAEGQRQPIPHREAATIPKATPDVIIRNRGIGVTMPDWVRSARKRSNEKNDAPPSSPRSLRSWISTCSWLILFSCSFMRRLIAARRSLRPA